MGEITIAEDFDRLWADQEGACWLKYALPSSRGNPISGTDKLWIMVGGEKNAHASMQWNNLS